MPQVFSQATSSFWKSKDHGVVQSTALDLLEPLVPNASRYLDLLLLHLYRP